MKEEKEMSRSKQHPLKGILDIRGMRGALTAFAGLIIIYIAFGMINPTVFTGQNVMNLLRSMSKYLLIGIGQSYCLITGNIDLSIGSVVGMSAMITATLMTMGMNPWVAVAVTPLMQSQVVATGSSSGALTLTLASGDTVNYANVRGVL